MSLYIPRFPRRRRTPAAILARRPLLLLGAAGALAAGLAACSGGAAEGADSATDSTAAAAAVVLAPQDVAVATVADIVSGITLTGSLEPADRVTVTAQVGGTLGAIAVDRGTPVRRGQRLTTIEAAGIRSQAAGAQASVAAAEASLAAARTQRDAAQRLYDAGATSRVSFENAQAAYRAAEAQLAAARAQATAAGEAAGYTVVTAPLTGIVADRQAESGEAVSSGDPIVTIVNTAVLELAGRVAVNDAGAIRVGQPVSFALDAFPGREFRGTVARKDPAADPGTRQVGIYVRLPNPNAEVTAGQFARGRVSGRRVEGAVTIPGTAVLGTGSDAAVIVIEDGRLARRPVTVGTRDDQAGRVAIESGLQAGEKVLARPAPNVAVGRAVVVADEQPAAAADTTTER